VTSEQYDDIKAITEQQVLMTKNDANATWPKVNLVVYDVTNDEDAPAGSVQVALPTITGYRRMWTTPLYQEGVPLPKQPTTKTSQVGSTPSTDDLRSIRVEAYSDLDGEEWGKRIRAPHAAVRRLLQECNADDLEARTSGWNTAEVQGGKQLTGYMRVKAHMVDELIRHSGMMGTFLSPVPRSSEPVTWIRKDPSES
jgi:hypothetical protein